MNKFKTIVLLWMFLASGVLSNGDNTDSTLPREDTIFQKKGAPRVLLRNGKKHHRKHGKKHGKKTTKTPTNSPTVSPTSNPTKEPTISCDSILPYNASTIYQANDSVTINNKVYECKPFPFTEWCSQKEFVPDTGLDCVWNQAWTFIQDCDSSTEPNYDCDSIDPYDVGGLAAVYNATDKCVADDQIFECRGWPFTDWCSQDPDHYRPVTGSHWQQAWMELSECPGSNFGILTGNDPRCPGPNFHYGNKKETSSKSQIMLEAVTYLMEKQKNFMF